MMQELSVKNFCFEPIMTKDFKTLFLQNTTFNDLLLESTDLKMHFSKCNQNNHKEGGHNCTGWSWNFEHAILNILLRESKN